MAKDIIYLLAVALPLVVLLSGGHAAAEESLCRMDERGFIACLPCVTGAAAAQPSERCCAALSKADLPCLCRYKDSPVLPRMGVKPDLAEQLPAKCKLSVPAECS